MDEPAARNQQVLETAMEELLAELPAEVADGIRLASVPHWFDPPLLRALLGEVQSQAVLASLAAMGLTRTDSQSRMTYPVGIRLYLRSWCQHNAATAYEEANRRCLAYFQRLDQPVSQLLPGRFGPEILYHSLLEDEAGALPYLRASFDEAESHYQLGQAERLVRRAAEAVGELSPSGQSWVAYTMARLDLLYERGDRGESAFAALLGQTPTGLLGGLIRWSLGQLRVSQQGWSAGVGLYREALHLLKAEKDFLGLAQVQMAMGEAYWDLAQRSGGFSPALDALPHGPGSWLRRLQAWPFYLYRRLVRVLPFLPNWYFGANYQDWIVAYLFAEAAAWYRRAGQSLEQLSSTAASPYQIQIQLHLADLEHRLGRWAAARRRYSAVEELESVANSRYRTARLQAAQGQALLREGKADEAAALLAPALAELRHFEDTRAAAESAWALGTVRTWQGRDQEALADLAASLVDFAHLGDLQSRTRIAWQIEADFSSPPSTTLPRAPGNSQRAQQRKRPVGQESADTAVQRQAQALAASVIERQTITRFPDLLLRRYRRLALYFVLPLNYLLTFPFAWSVGEKLVKVLEGEVRLWLAGIQADFSANTILILALFALSPLFLLWIYHLVYSGLGLLSTRLLGRHLLAIEREQPAVITVMPQGLTYQQASRGRPIQLAWTQIKRWESREYLLLGQPLAIFSRFRLSAGGETVEVSAGTVGYEPLRHTVVENLQTAGQGVGIENQNLTLFRGWGWMGTLFLAVALSLVGFTVTTWGTELGVVRLIFPPLLVRIVFGLLILYPLILFGQLLARRLVTPAAARASPLTPDWVLGLGCLFQLMITLVWLGSRLGWLDL